LVKRSLYGFSVKVNDESLGELHTKKEGMTHKTIMGNFFQIYRKSEGIIHTNAKSNIAANNNFSTKNLRSRSNK